MKRFTLGFFIAFSLSTFLSPSLSKAATLGSVKVSHTEISDSLKTAYAAEDESIMLRLQEIKLLSKTALTASEKKELKSEVRALKTRHKDISGGVYLSGGAIILIIILLILIL